MRGCAVAGALLALSLSAAAGETIAPAVPALTSAATVAGAPRGPAVTAQARRAPAPQAAPEEPGESQALRPWLLVVTGLVLAAMMATRRL